MIFIKISIFLLLIPNLIFSQKTSQEIEQEINNNNKTLQDLSSSIKRLEKDINSIENSEKYLVEYIDILDQKIEYRIKQISILRKQSNSLGELINKSQNEIKNTNEQVSLLKSHLEKRIQYLYKNGNEKLFSKVILSNNWNMASNKIKYLNILVKEEKKITNELLKKIGTLEIEKKKLAKDKKKQQEILKEAEAVKIDLEKDKKKKNKEIKKITNEKEILTENLIIKKKEISDIEKEIIKLIKDKKTAKKREDELARERALQNKATSGNFSKMKGRLQWPLSGRIINKYGTTTNRELHTITENIGINIKATKNSGVYSVLDGVVSVITYMRNYGNTIIISHGDGFYTVYANIENILFNEGDYIPLNAKIATISNSENPLISTDYYLHFEIWKDETHLNPEIWLQKK